MRCNEVVDMLTGHIPKDKMLDDHLRECKSCMQVRHVVKKLEAEGARLRREDFDTAQIQEVRRAAVAAFNEKRVTTPRPWILRPAGISLATAAVVLLGITLFVHNLAMPGDSTGIVKALPNKRDTPAVKIPVAVNIDTAFVEIQTELRTTLNSFRERYGLTIRKTSADPDFQNLRHRLAVASEGLASELPTFKMLNGSGGLNE